MAVKIAFIGAGSVGFTRKLVQDMLLVPELRDAEIALHDISERNLDLVSELLAKDVAAKARLAEHEAAGTRVKTQPWPGAARIAPRSVEQLRADDDAKVLDADKTGAGQSSR